MNRYYDVIVISNQFYIVTLWQWVEMWNSKIFALDYWKEYEPWQMTNMMSALVILKILLRQVFSTFHKCFGLVNLKINKKYAWVCAAKMSRMANFKSKCVTKEQWLEEGHRATERAFLNI